MADSVESSSIELRMSVTSIKRVDPYVKEILATATHVALYKFNTTISEWEKTETEGALFIYSRNGEPYHSIMVMNRLNRNNLIEPIVKDFDYQMQVPFLLYRNSKSKIFGIWFFNREECIRITFLIESIMENLKDSSKQIPKKTENGVDIFSLLSKAQEDFNRTPTKQDAASPVSSSTPRIMDGTSKSVMDFFAKASTKSTHKNDGENVLQKLMANPVHTVEHIEKQQRSITPQEQISLKKTPHPDRHSVPISFPSTSSAPDTTTSQHRKRSENGLNFISVSPPKPPTSSASPLAYLLQNQSIQDESTTEILGTSPFAQFLEQKPQLMTPMMFTTPSTSATLITPQQQLPATPQQPLTINPQLQHQQSTSSNTATTTTTTTTTTQDIDQIDPLTEKQMAQALIYLIKNKSDFTRQIHEAYVDSIMEKVNSNSNLFEK